MFDRFLVLVFVFLIEVHTSILGNKYMLELN